MAKYIANVEFVRNIVPNCNNVPFPKVITVIPMKLYKLLYTVTSKRELPSLNKCSCALGNIESATTLPLTNTRPKELNCSGSSEYSAMEYRTRPAQMQNAQRYSYERNFLELTMVAMIMVGINLQERKTGQ